MNGIFAIGTRGIYQASMRDDGVWFIRKTRRPLRPGWHAWERVPGNIRPENAWYNPALGKAHLPKD